MGRSVDPGEQTANQKPKDTDLWWTKKGHQGESRHLPAEAAVSQMGFVPLCNSCLARETVKTSPNKQWWLRGDENTSRKSLRCTSHCHKTKYQERNFMKKAELGWDLMRTL